MIERLISELKKFDNSVVTFGEPATEQEIEESETHLGQNLPNEYKEFVRKYNGLDFDCEYILKVGNNICNTYSINKVYDFEHYNTENPMPLHLIPFAPDGFGNHYCFDMQKEGIIVFWQHDIDYTTTQPEIVYKSMADMIQEVFIDWSELNYDGSPKR